jgi:hypothetical protein
MTYVGSADMKFHVTSLVETKLFHTERATNYDICDADKPLLSNLFSFVALTDRNFTSNIFRFKINV